MKKFAIAIMMCVAAMSAKAQVITSETVNNVYEEVSNKPNSEFAFNAEFTGKDITTMYVYKKSNGAKDMQPLKPHLKYEYAYAADGTLTSKVTYHWNDSQNNWDCESRYNYTLINDQYSVEFSRYNPIAHTFDQPIDKMVYQLFPFDSVENVSYYRRDLSSPSYQLISQAHVTDQNRLLAER